jgi:hypothetical protein
MRWVITTPMRTRQTGHTYERVSLPGQPECRPGLYTKANESVGPRKSPDTQPARVRIRPRFCVSSK